MLKTSKRYVINTNTVNNYGYRVISEGIDQTDYNNNPIMLWMHYRPTGESRDEVLCLGSVKEIMIDKQGTMTGQPYFDDSDTFAVSIYNKYENGTYNMLSLLAQPIEASTEPKDMIDGQTGPTFTKSKLKEISCVDIGGNPKAHGVALCDANGSIIRLADFQIKPVTNITTPPAKRINSVTPELSAIMANAVTVGKFKQGEAEDLLNSVTDNNSVKALKASIATRKIQPENVEGVMHPYLIKMAAKSYDDIDMKEPGGMKDLRSLSPDLYKSKFFDKHGRMPMELK